MRNAGYFLLCFICIHLCFFSDAQPGTTIYLKKPDKYENRTLASEKTTESKIKSFKKFYQNTITHYNYFFNASLRLDDIVNRAKQGFKDDYTKLLPYYNYTLDATAADTEIDTIIYKCNAGILLHDLRNDWVDDLYFLMGKAYYLRKNFDSAEQVFLYVNYAFAPKDDGYDIPVGSNASGTEFSIATKEKNKILSAPPRRNEDLIWVAKNYIEEDKSSKASAILEMLRHDPNFPGRLQPQWHETMGYIFYRAGQFDSAAYHLSRATDMDDDKLDKARREYLTAQLYMASGLKEEAEKYFVRSAEHTVDPFMAVYASLNAINASPDSSDIVNKKIESLIRLAKKDRYVAYRDLVYYTAAEVLAQDGNYPQAYEYAQKSLGYNTTNPVQRSRTFMLLGDLDYLRPDYLLAKNAYDSVDVTSLATEEDQVRLTTRLAALQVIAANIKAIKIEDSLQTVARLPEAERTAFVRKTVRQLRKAQGLKEDEGSTFVNPAVQLREGENTAGNDLFAAQAAAKGEWYFNNNSLKSTGFTSFRATWGNRPDVDDWRRIDAVSKQIAAIGQGNPDGDDSEQVDLPPGAKPTLDPGTSPVETIMSGEISYDVLMSYLPLTEEKVKESDTKIIDAFFHNGKQFQDELQDYYAAIESYDSLMQRFPENGHHEEVLFNLYYCYNKIGRKFSADSVAGILNTKFGEGNFAGMLNKQKKSKGPKTEDEATIEYEKIYNLFIEGRFEEAKTAKTAADEKYGNSYWTPQLLYIESIYFVSQRDDSTAIETLTALNDQFSSSPLAEKAQTMIDVLQRRAEIEEYLTNLQIERLPEDEPSRIVNLSPVENIIDKKEIKRDSIVNKSAENVVANPNVDSAATMGASMRSYVFNPSDPQFVGIILSKVDPVYINETRNAFNRYNQVNFNNQKISSSPSKINDSLNLVLLGPFSDAATAVIYLEKVKPKTAGMIIPWLKPEKYSFTIISQPNLDLLKETKDMAGYTEMIQKVLPGKF